MPPDFEEFDLLSSWSVSDIAIELALLNEYLAKLEEFFESERQKQEERLAEGIKSGRISVEEYTGPELTFESIMLEQLWIFEDRLRKSLMVSLYSLVESTILKECQAGKAADPTILLELSDLKGQNSLETAKTYFEKVLHREFPSKRPEWATIVNYEMLRHCIVHGGGKIDNMRPNTQKALRQFALQEQNIQVLADAEIYLEHGFCENALSVIEDFFHSWLYPNDIYGGSV